MSQEKVDRYKKDKANRKQIMRRQKIERIAGTCAAALVCAAIIVWAGFGVYQKLNSSSNSTAVTTEVDLSSINDYVSGLTSN